MDNTGGENKNEVGINQMKNNDNSRSESVDET